MKSWKSGNEMFDLVQPLEGVSEENLLHVVPSGVKIFPFAISVVTCIGRKMFTFHK
jgi:hypothetical protein